MSWNSLKLPLDYFLVETLHILCDERRLQRSQLVHDASQGPDVALGRVGLVLPDLGRTIVRRARLCHHEPRSGYLAHIHIAELDTPVLQKKHIGAFDVTVNDICGVQSH